MSVEFFLENSYKVSKLITNKYSTSFSIATFMLKKDMRDAIYAIYGFVRLADEIVDSFHNFEKAALLQKIEEDLQFALDNGISTNVILMSFADTVKKYNIKREYINAFMESMKYDLTKKECLTSNDLQKYIYGSADVAGLMCLKVFCNGNESLYIRLESLAQKLGSAFQKVNFFRYLKFDMRELGRIYFPEISTNKFDANAKKMIEQSIESDFNEAWKGIKELPGRSKLAVALAYYYYKSLIKLSKQNQKRF